MIGRRHLAVMLGVLAAARPAPAQTKAKRRLAFVHPTILAAPRSERRHPWSLAFYAELRRLGYAEDSNLIVEPWSGKGETARYEALAREVLATNPDVVVVFTSRLALGFRGSEVPVVFSGGSALAYGLVDSLARPGGNITGFSSEYDPALRGKAVEFLHDIVPMAKTVALLVHRSLWANYEPAFVVAARSRGLTPVALLLDDPIGPAEYRRVFSEVGIGGVDLLVVGDLEENIAHRRLIVDLAAQYRLPASYLGHAESHFGEMASYGAEVSEHPRLKASYVADVLNGRKPAEMPVRVTDQYKLVINVKTAKALGLTIPPAILARAGEVIE